MRGVVDLGHLALQRPVTKPAAQIDYEPRQYGTARQSAPHTLVTFSFSRTLPLPPTVGSLAEIVRASVGAAIVEERAKHRDHSFFCSATEHVTGAPRCCVSASIAAATSPFDWHALTLLIFFANVNIDLAGLVAILVSSTIIYSFLRRKRMALVSLVKPVLHSAEELPFWFRPVSKRGRCWRTVRRGGRTIHGKARVGSPDSASCRWFAVR